MDPRELELVALTQLISRYRTGLPIESHYDLSTLKQRLSASIGTDDADTEINIGTLHTESNVTIVEQTVECDEHDHERTEPTATKEPQDTQESEQSETEKPKDTLGGRLFKFFKDDKNDTV